jgi:GDP-mannose 6-dehydrogenase
MVLRTGKKRVGVLGLSFKPGTDDLRESPMVALIETLLGKGIKLMIFDREVELAKLFGANKEYIEREIPHISSIMCSRLDEVLAQSEVVVITKKSEEFLVDSLRADRNRIIIDLARLIEDTKSQGNYHGIGW